MMIVSGKEFIVYVWWYIYEYMFLLLLLFLNTFSSPVSSAVLDLNSRTLKQCFITIIIITCFSSLLLCVVGLRPTVYIKKCFHFFHDHRNDSSKQPATSQPVIHMRSVLFIYMYVCI